MREREETDFRTKIIEIEDSLFKGPVGKYYKSPDDLKDAERKGNHFKSPLTGRTYEESDRMRIAEEEYTRQNYKKNEIDKKQIKK